MEILIVRHAIAVKRGTPGYEDDDRRPVTEKGRKRMVRAASGIARLLPRVEALHTSPLVRARQTADILADAWKGRLRPEIAEELRPGVGAAEVARWLSKLRSRGPVVVVGHEPDLSLLLSHLVAAGGAGAAWDFKKGGAALVALDRTAGGGKGRLRFFATPRMLRLLAR